MEERLLLADSIGLFNTAASQFFLKNTISAGPADTVDARTERGVGVISERQASSEAVDHALLELMGDGLLESGSVEPSELVLV